MAENTIDWSLAGWMCEISDRNLSDPKFPRRFLGLSTEFTHSETTGMSAITAADGKKMC